MSQIPQDIQERIRALIDSVRFCLLNFCVYEVIGESKELNSLVDNTHAAHAYNAIFYSLMYSVISDSYTLLFDYHENSLSVENIFQEINNTPSISPDCYNILALYELFKAYKKSKLFKKIQKTRNKTISHKDIKIDNERVRISFLTDFDLQFEDIDSMMYILMYFTEQLSTLLEIDSNPFESDEYYYTSFAHQLLKKLNIGHSITEN